MRKYIPNRYRYSAGLSRHIDSAQKFISLSIRWTLAGHELYLTNNVNSAYRKIDTFGHRTGKHKSTNKKKLNIP